MKKTDILKKIEKAYNLISEARLIIEDLNEEQRNDVDNYPENLQTSSNYERSESIADLIEEMLSSLETIESEIEETREEIENI